MGSVVVLKSASNIDHNQACSHVQWLQLGKYSGTEASIQHSNRLHKCILPYDSQEPT